MRDFRELAVWRKSHALTLKIYEATAPFPKLEQFGLTSQMRRAAASIGANIAEGAGKYSNADLLRFLQIGYGSASELQNHLLLAKDLGFLDARRYARLDGDLCEVKMMLTAFMQYLRRQRKPVGMGN